MELTQKKLKELLDYDPETGVFRWRKARQRINAGDITGCPNKIGYLRISVAGIQCFAYRLAWLYIHGDWPEGKIDHINGNCADNRIGNLRVVTNRENLQNQRRHREGHFPGVSFSKAAQKWRAMIQVQNKHIYLGLFTTEQAAHEAYLLALPYFTD